MVGNDNAQAWMGVNATSQCIVVRRDRTDVYWLGEFEDATNDERSVKAKRFTNNASDLIWTWF